MEHDAPAYSGRGIVSFLTHTRTTLIPRESLALAQRVAAASCEIQQPVQCPSVDGWPGPACLTEFRLELIPQSRARRTE